MTSQPDRKRQRTEPARHLQRLGDDELIQRLAFAMGSTGAFSVMCHVSRRFRRLAAIPDAVGHLRVRSDKFTDADCAALSQSLTAWAAADLSRSTGLTDVAGLVSVHSDHRRGAGSARIPDRIGYLFG